MLKRTGWVTSGRRLLAALAVVAVGLVGTANASALNKPEVLRILELPEGFTPLSASFDPRQPLKAGDSFGFVQGLYTWSGTKRGKRAGHIEGWCGFVSAVSNGAGTVYCAVEAFLPEGRILFEGFQHVTAGPGRSVWAVTGGTGHYRDARGWVDIKDIGISGKTADVFHLVP